MRDPQKKVLREAWSSLKLKGKNVAANYSFAFDHKVHFFQSGMIPHKNKHIRLGLLLHSYCIEDAIKEGYKEYDFLKIGAKGADYKKIWENYSRDLIEIRISKCSYKENIYRLLTRIFYFLRKIKHSISCDITQNS